jgi:hypothetical protein
MFLLDKLRLPCLKNALLRFCEVAVSPLGKLRLPSLKNTPYCDLCDMAVSPLGKFRFPSLKNASLVPIRSGEIRHSAGSSIESAF